MPILPSTRFTGSIVHGEVVQMVEFDASVDDNGVLSLTFEPVVGPVDISLLQLTDATGRRGVWMTLVGTAADGPAFASESFEITGYSHRTGEAGSQIALQGHCAEADITTPLAEPASTSQLWWGLRRFRSFGWLPGDVDIGRVAMGGAEPDAEHPQRLSASLVIQLQGVQDAEWFDAATARLGHIARVMSFASGAYLRPYVTRQVAGERAVLRAYSRSDTPEPFYPPFVFLNLQPIFDLACGGDAAARTAFEALDPALRWLLAPAHYDEMRLTAAMTALENLVDQAFPDDAALFIKSSTFKKLASAVRALIAGWGLPEGMKDKVPELNRRTFADKLQSYLDTKDVVTSDLPDEQLRGMVKARNAVVHKGVYFDPEIESQPDVWDHMLLARELVTRVLLAELGFVGNYFAPLYPPNTQLRFPSCQRLTDEQGRAVPETSASGDGASSGPASTDGAADSA
jgi:hypothetical protein